MNGVAAVSISINHQLRDHMVNVQDHNIVMKGMPIDFLPPPKSILSPITPDSLALRSAVFLFTLQFGSFLTSKCLTCEFEGRTCRISISLCVTHNKYRSKTCRYDYDRRVWMQVDISMCGFHLALVCKKIRMTKWKKWKKKTHPGNAT